MFVQVGGSRKQIEALSLRKATKAELATLLRSHRGGPSGQALQVLKEEAKKPGNGSHP